MVPTEIKRLWLRRIYALCAAGGGSTYATLELAIQGEAFKALDAVKAGTVASTSIRDQAVSFSNRDNGATPEDMAAMCGELLDIYDLSSAALVSSGIASPTDAQIKTEMLDRLQVVTSLQVDFSDCRRFA